MKDLKTEYMKALKEMAKEAREISGGKIKWWLRVATKSHALNLARLRVRLSKD
jgi:hypothetical protein